MKSESSGQVVPPPEEPPSAPASPEKELSAETKRKIKEWSLSWFQSRDLSQPPKDRHRDLNSVAREVELSIAEMIGPEEKERVEERFLPPRYRAGVEVFLNELVAYTKEISRAHGQEAAADFLNNIHEDLFGFSPNITNHLSMESMIVFASKANREPEIRGWFGQDAVGEAVYELSFASPDYIREVFQHILKRPTEEVMDVIYQLRTMGADAIANGSWAEKAFERIYEFLESVAQNNKSPLLKYAAELSLKRLRNEEEDPSLGVITYRGNQNAGRLSEAASAEETEQSNLLARRMNPDLPTDNYSFFKIASDAVAAFDATRLPMRIAHIRVEDLPGPAEQEPLRVRRILAHLERLGPTPRILDFITKRIGGFKPGAMGQIKLFKKLGISNSSDQAEIKKTLEEYLSSTLTKIEAVVPKVRFEEYDRIPEDPELNPFLSKKEDNLPLLLQHLHQPDLRRHIEADLGIQLADLPLREQVHFLRYLAGRDTAGFDRLRNALKHQSANARDVMTSFLSCAEDTRYGDAVLELAEKLPPEIARTVFGKYRQIAEASERVRQYVRENFQKQGEHDESKVNQIVRHLLRRGNGLLVDIAAKQGSPNFEEVVERLDRVKAELFLFAASFKVASESESIGFAAINGSEPLIQDTASIGEKEKEEMRRIYRENRPGYSPALLKETLHEFEEGMNAERTKFYILKNTGDVVAFMRLDQLGKGRLYAASLNVRTELRGSSIGSAMLRVVLDEQSRENVIEAVAYSKNPMLKHYVDDFGFEIVGKLPNYEGTGELFYKMERPKGTVSEARQAA